MVVRGRAASPIRPGLFIREQLLMEEELNPSEIHTRLRDLVREVNKERPRSQRIRAPTWASFYRYFKHLEYFFLVELTGRTEPVVSAPEALLHISDSNVVPARRVFYRLTGAGTADPPHEAFHNPVGLWRELGGYPAEVVVRPRVLPPPPPPPPERPPVAPPRRRPTDIESLKAEANAFLPEIMHHIELAGEQRTDLPSLNDLIDRMGEHYDRVQNAWERSRGRRREELRELRDTLERTEAYFLQVLDTLEAEDWGAAAAALEQVSNCCRWPPSGEVAPPSPEEVPPEVQPLPEPTRAPAPGFKPYTSIRATRSTVAKLADHLEALAALPEDTPGLAEEIEKLTELVEGWQGEAEDSLANEEAKDNPDPNREDMFSNRAEEFGNAHDSLQQGEPDDWVEAAQHLRQAWET